MAQDQPTRTARRRRVEDKEVRRQQLVQATIESIARHGITGTTLATVSRGAGLSVGIVNFHFETKDNLLRHTLEYLAEQHHAHWMRAYEDADLSPADKIRAIINATFDPEICTPKKLAVWYAFYGDAFHRKTYRYLVGKIDDERFEITVGLCEALCASQPGQTMHPSHIANMIEALVDGLWQDLQTCPDDYTREEARDTVFMFLANTFPDHFEAPDLPKGRIDPATGKVVWD